MNKIDAIPHLKAGKILSNSVEDELFCYFMGSDGNIYKARISILVSTDGSGRTKYILDPNSAELCKLNDLPNTGWRIEFDNEKSS